MEPPTFKGTEILVDDDELDLFDATTVTWVGEVCRVAAEVPIGIAPRFAPPAICVRHMESHPDLCVGWTLSRLRRGLLTHEHAVAMLEPHGLQDRLGAATVTAAATGSEDERP
jgi:hypothetical protein